MIDIDGQPAGSAPATDWIYPIATVQRVAGVLLLLTAAGLLALWLLMVALSAYELYAYIGRLVPEATLEHYLRPIISFVYQNLVAALSVLLPSLLLAALGVFKLFAARVIPSRTPFARIMGVGAALIDLMWCGPGLLIGIPTLIIVLSPAPPDPHSLRDF